MDPHTLFQVCIAVAGLCAVLPAFNHLGTGSIQQLLWLFSFSAMNIYGVANHSNIRCTLYTVL